MIEPRIADNYMDNYILFTSSDRLAEMVYFGANHAFRGPMGRSRQPFPLEMLLTNGMPFLPQSYQIQAP